MTTTPITTWGTIDGREITFPMAVDDFNSATLGFSVPADAAAALLPGDAFEIAEIGPGTAQLIISIVDYRQNPWGDYNEVNLGFLARPAGAPEDVMGSFVYRMPVDQEFTCKAGNEVMGFPKVVVGIDATYTDSHVTFELRDGDDVALTVTVPRAPALSEATRIDAVSYSYLDGVPQATPLGMDLASGFIEADQVDLTLGTGPIADELRTLGLPKPADFATWGEGLSAVFQLGTAL
ncbi:acetoacetate decarboxylase family protein [Nocardioides sp.]|uniref:acetoacetate decarboxylase family protein n=1 Tax=Nocardioides sp. TaxID=35761 RepID=UPI002B275198|nr:acetoacetate decarboxylase family protein [Nocardioides sp.]